MSLPVRESTWCRWIKTTSSATDIRGETIAPGAVGFMPISCLHPAPTDWVAVDGEPFECEAYGSIYRYGKPGKAKAKGNVAG